MPVPLPSTARPHAEHVQPQAFLLLDQQDRLPLHDVCVTLATSSEQRGWTRLAARMGGARWEPSHEGARDTTSTRKTSAASSDHTSYPKVAVPLEVDTSHARIVYLAIRERNAAARSPAATRASAGHTASRLAPIIPDLLSSILAALFIVVFALAERRGR